MFVPCGGRPESIDFSSATRLITDGRPNIPYIVEGANLFITQEAKLRLEKAGTIVFKDASANKGGVTSSSLEVLASLSFDDAGFIEHMCVKDDGTVPEFYQAYVRQVQATIRENARLEFETLWREGEATGESRSILSDRLSIAITRMDEELQATELWDNVELRRSVLNDALPKLLLDKIGLDSILERVCLPPILLDIFSMMNTLANHTIYRSPTPTSAPSSVLSSPAASSTAWASAPAPSASSPS